MGKLKLKKHITNTIIIIFLLGANLFGFSQVGIGSNPDNSAQLDISSTNKGILVPRISLDSIKQTTLDNVNTAAESLLIYNTNENVIGGSGKGFYTFDGTQWRKLVTHHQNVAVITIDTGQITMTNSSGQDVPGYDGALEPIFFNPQGFLEVKLVVRYSDIQGNVKFQLRAHNNTTETYPIIHSDFGTYATTQNGGVATSDWVEWNAGTSAYEIHLFSWISNYNPGDFVTIESAYLLVRSK